MTNTKEAPTLSSEEEENLMSSYAIYTHEDETHLNAAFPEFYPFPQCQDFEIFDRVKFITRVVYPIYKTLVRSRKLIFGIRKTLRTGIRVCMVNDMLPSLKILKERYPVLYHTFHDSSSDFFMIDGFTSLHAFQMIHSVEMMCLVLLSFIIFSVEDSVFLGSQWKEKKSLI
jgi:hypothetical protein